MSLTSSGEIHLSASIGGELGESGVFQISLTEASDGTVATINTSNDSGDRPNGSAPHAMSEFYSYDHDLSSTSWSATDNTNLHLSGDPGATPCCESGTSMSHCKPSTFSQPSAGFSCSVSLVLS